MKTHKKRVIYYLTNAILVILMACFSYAFGSSLPSTRFRGTLMSLARYEAIDSEKFIHCIIRNQESDSSKKMNDFIRFHRESYGMYKFWQSYIETFDDDSVKSYSVINIKESSDEQPFIHQQWQSTPLATLSAFSDHQTMECISLYLHDSNRGSISGKFGASAGAYIPASVADSLIEENDDLNNYDDILNNEILFTVGDDNKSVIFSINNIYYDFTNDNHDLSSFSKKTNNYNDFFAKTSKSPIIVYDKTFFGNGDFVLAYDLCDKFGNADLFFKRVIGYEFFKNGITVSFYDADGTRLTDFETLNSISNEYSNTLSSKSSAFLSIAVILFCLIPLFVLVNRKYLNSEKTATSYLFLTLPYLAIFLVAQIFSVIFKRTYTYVVNFNYIGSILILLNATIVLTVLFVLRKRYAKTTK